MSPIANLRFTLAACIIAALALLAVLHLHLLSALIAGLFVFALIDMLAPHVQRYLPRSNAYRIAVFVLSVVVVGLITLAVLLTISLVRKEIGDPKVFFDNLNPLLDRARGQLPGWIVDHLPDNITEMRVAALDWLRQHASTLQLAGKAAARSLAHLLIGMVLGAMIALAANGSRGQGRTPFIAALHARSRNLLDAFRDIVFAQVKISAINTVLTGIFLLALLPLFSTPIPFAKTLVVITFIVGLLPVVGNLVSNTVIFIAALSVSFGDAVAALTFLVLIHKLEYFLNARIVGTQIHARAWELLVAMLVMESAFGIGGLIAAPIYYAFLKRELAEAKLV
ncbi:AI-2E family transporter [Dokdonella sp.]|uniref:AI-2E family transporter n=1 Tax=Dokdonella sp. TaxID=2291710 RepID=UPI0025BBDA87|nr:AI-2E family transporter [Dokdonella sp.]MBX3687821.1 AI-2E family transporter [Dokdonella sp.]